MANSPVDALGPVASFSEQFGNWPILTEESRPDFSVDANIHSLGRTAPTEYQRRLLKSLGVVDANASDELGASWDVKDARPYMAYLHSRYIGARFVLQEALQDAGLDPQSNDFKESKDFLDGVLMALTYAERFVNPNELRAYIQLLARTEVLIKTQPMYQARMRGKDISTFQFKSGSFDDIFETLSNRYSLVPETVAAIKDAPFDAKGKEYTEEELQYAEQQHKIRQLMQLLKESKF